MKDQCSFRERAEFSRRILRSSWRILQSPMPNEHPVKYHIILSVTNQTFTTSVLGKGLCLRPLMDLCMCALFITRHWTESYMYM